MHRPASTTTTQGSAPPFRADSLARIKSAVDRPILSPGTVMSTRGTTALSLLPVPPEKSAQAVSSLPFGFHSRRVAPVGHDSGLLPLPLSRWADRATSGDVSEGPRPFDADRLERRVAGKPSAPKGA